jgi:hypothetical protein
MTCEHLMDLERALIAAGIKETSRGQAWSQNCREWVYFDCFLPAQLIRQKFKLADCVEDHEHRGTHDGQESGFTCSIHHDGIMGHHPASGVTARSFNPQ